MKFSNPFRRLPPWVNQLLLALLFVAVVLALPPIFRRGFPKSFAIGLNILILIGIFSVAALGLNFIVGYCGLLNLGFAGFMLIGAYTAGILMKEYHFSFWSASIVSVAHGALWGLLLGIPTLRLTGDYFAVVTFGFSQLVIMIATNWVKFTRGPRSYPGVPRPVLSFEWLRSLGIYHGTASLRYQFSVGERVGYWYLVATMLGLCMLAANRLSHSRLGRAWRALREDEVAAEACGIYATRFKATAFAISAGYGGLAGALYTAYFAQADYRYFEFMTSVFVLCYVVLGGMGTVLGPVVGTAVLVSLSELLRDSPALYIAPMMKWWPAAHDWMLRLPWVPDMRLIVYGIILILVIRFRPEGLVPSRSRRRELRGIRDSLRPQEQALFDLRSQ